MDIPNWLPLWVVLLSAFTSGLLFEVKANPGFPVYNIHRRAYSPVTEKDCFCFDKNPSLKYVSEQLNNGNALERLVVYYYKDTKTHEVTMYTPGVEKQHLIPDLALEDDDSLTRVTNQWFSDLLNNNRNFIPVKRPRNRGPTDDLPRDSAELYDNQSQRPSEPYDNPSQRPLWQFDNQSQRPSGQYDYQSQYALGPYDSQSERPSGQYDNQYQYQSPFGPYDSQSNRPSGQYDIQSQSPLGPYDSQSERPSGQYDNQPQRPLGPYDSQSERPSGQYDNQPQRPLGPNDNRSEGPSGQYDNQSQRPLGPYDSQSERPSGQYDNQSQRPLGPYDSQSQRPLRQYDSRSQRPLGPYDSQSQRPSWPYNGKFDNPLGPYDNQSGDYTNGPVQRTDLTNELESDYSDNVYKPDNQAYVTFGKWFTQQIKRVKQVPVNSDTIDLNLLKNLVQKILKDNGMYVSSDGVLTDSKGNVKDLNNLQLRPILIGKSVGYDKILSSSNKVSLAGEDPYLESVLISLSNPSKILGILPLRQLHLPKPSLGRPGLGFVKYAADLHTHPGLEDVVKYASDLQTRPGLEGVVKYPADLQTRPGLEGVVKYPADLQTRPSLEGIVKYPAELQNRPGLGIVKYPADLQTRPDLEGIVKYPADLQTRPGLEGVVKYPADVQNRPGLEGIIKYPADLQNRPGLEGVVKYPGDLQTRPGLEGVVKYPADLQTRPNLEGVVKYPADLQTPPVTERNQEQPSYPCNKPNCFGPSTGLSSTSTVVPPSSDQVQIQRELYYTIEDSSVEKTTVPPPLEKVSDTKEDLGLIGKPEENDLQQNLKDSKKSQKEIGVKQFNAKNLKKGGVVLSDGRRAKGSIQRLYETKKQKSERKHSVPKGLGARLQNLIKQLTNVVMKETDSKEEEKPDFRIIGGNAATSSGSPISNKGRRAGW